MMPAARVGDLHVCPMVTGVVPHVGGPILPPGGLPILIGGMPAARVGDERTAFANFLRGMQSHPVFVPAVEELLKLRVSRRLVEAHRWDFLRAARFEPRLAEKIFDYLLLHRAPETAQCIVRTIPMDEVSRVRLAERLTAAISSKNRETRCVPSQA